MDPELQGQDPIWKFLLSGKAHVYYALIVLIVLGVALAAGAPGWLGAIRFSACGRHLRRQLGPPIPPLT